MTQIRLGQILLILCCIFYLIWWSLAFHPSHGNSHASGIDGWLLLVTAGFGLTGLAMSLIGVRDNTTANGFVSGIGILAGGMLVYMVLLFGTKTLLHRQVTTELVLIIGWAMLEIACTNTAFSLENLSRGRVITFLIIVLAATISSLIFYLLYYRVEAMLGYYFGMIPLITTGISMMIFLFFTKTAQL